MLQRCQQSKDKLTKTASKTLLLNHLRKRELVLQNTSKLHLKKLARRKKEEDVGHC